MHQKVRTSTLSAYRRQQHQYIYHRCQLGHVIPGHAILVAVCIFMLPMLEVAAELKQPTTTHHSNPADLHGDHVTFCHSSLMLPSLDNMLPAIVLQNRVVRSNIHRSHSLSHSSIRHVFLKLGVSVCYSLKVVGMVMVLLLLLSGDIETNPGPDGEYCLVKCCMIERTGMRLTKSTVMNSWTNPVTLQFFLHLSLSVFHS